VVAVSQASRDALLKLWGEQGLAPAAVEVIPLPVDFELERPAFVPPPAAADVLYVARLKEVKNHAALLAACELMWNGGEEFSLTLIGCEDEARESARILDEVRRLQAAGRPVTWRAQVSEDELHAAYRASSFTAFASREEGFGLPIVESFWHGRPVICSGDGAMGEVSRGPGVIHADVTDPAELAAAMRTLLKVPTLLLDLARAAHARPQRTWADYWRELEPVLA
jgi:glycosyltransferase involved in cell wall biosynthesis